MYSEKKVKKKKESKSWKEKKLNCKIIRKISALTGFAALWMCVQKWSKRRNNWRLGEERGRRSSCYCNFRVRKVSSRNGEWCIVIKVAAIELFPSLTHCFVYMNAVHFVFVYLLLSHGEFENCIIYDSFFSSAFLFRELNCIRSSSTQKSTHNFFNFIMFCFWWSAMNFINNFLS